MPPRSTRSPPSPPQSHPYPSPADGAVRIYPRRSSEANSASSTNSSSSTYAPYMTAESSSSSSSSPAQDQDQYVGGSTGRTAGRQEQDIMANGSARRNRYHPQDPISTKIVSSKMDRGIGTLRSTGQPETRSSPYASPYSATSRYTSTPRSQPSTPPPEIPTKDSSSEQTTPKRKSLYAPSTAMPSSTSSPDHADQNQQGSPHSNGYNDRHMSNTPSSISSHSTSNSIGGSTVTARGFSSLTASGRKGKAPEPLDLSPSSSRKRADGANDQRGERVTNAKEGRDVRSSQASSSAKTPDERFSDPVEKVVTPLYHSHASPTFRPAGTSAPPSSGIGSAGRRASWFSHAVTGSPSHSAGTDMTELGRRGVGHGARRSQEDGGDTYDLYANLGRRVVTDPLQNRGSRDSLASPSTGRSSLTSRFNLTPSGSNFDIPLSAVFKPLDIKRPVSAAIPSPSAFIDAEVEGESMWEGTQGQEVELSTRSPRTHGWSQDVRAPRVSLYGQGDAKRLPSSMPSSASPARDLPSFSRQPSMNNLQTPQHRSTQQFTSPSTPGPTDPRYLDRAGLMGLGELATPRWVSSHPISPLGPPRTASGETSRDQSGYAASRRAQSISMSESYDSLAMIGQSPPMPSLPARLPPSRKVSGPRMRMPSNPAMRSSSRLAPPPPHVGSEEGSPVKGVGLGVSMHGSGGPAGGLLDIPRVSPLNFSFGSDSNDRDKEEPKVQIAQAMSPGQPPPSRKALPTSYAHTKRYSPQIAAGLNALREREQGAILRESKSADVGLPFPQPEYARPAQGALSTSYSSPLLDGPGRLRVRSTDTEEHGRQFSSESVGKTGSTRRELRSSSSSQRNLAALATLSPPELPRGSSIIRQFSSTRDFSHLPPSPSTASINQFMMRESGSKGSFSPSDDVATNSPASMASPAFPFPPLGTESSTTPVEQRRKSQGSLGRTVKRNSSKPSSGDPADEAFRDAALRKLDGLAKPSMSSLRSREKIHLDDTTNEVGRASEPREGGVRSAAPPTPGEGADRRRSEGTSSGSKRDFTPSTSPGTSWHSRAMSNVSTAPSSAELSHSGRQPSSFKRTSGSQDGSDSEIPADLDRRSQPVPPVPALPKDIDSLGRRPMPKSHTMSVLPRAAMDGTIREDYAKYNTAQDVPIGSQPSLSLSPPNSSALTSPSLASVDFSTSPSIGSVKSGSQRMSKKWSFSSAINLGFSRNKAEPTAFSPEDCPPVHDRSPVMSGDEFPGLTNAHSDFGLQVPTDHMRKTSFTSSASSDDLHGLREGGSAEGKGNKADTRSSRRTPSGIPFFRRSSSTSGTGNDSLSSKASSSTLQNNPSASNLSGQPSQSMKKMLGIGIPSMLQKSTSKKESIDISQAGVEHDAAQMGGGSGWANRKRGKTLTTEGPTSYKPAPPLPPMQMKDLPTATVDRVSSLKRPPGGGGSLLPVATDSSLRRSELAGGMARSATQNFPKTIYTDLLPSIKGSPSMAGARNKASPSPAITEGSPTSATPTRIPRISSKISIPVAYGLQSETPPQMRGSAATSARSSFSVASPSSQQERVAPTGGATLRSNMRNAENEGGPAMVSSNSSERGKLPSAVRQSSDQATTDLPRTEERHVPDHAAGNGLRKVSEPSGGAATLLPRTLPTAPIVKSHSVGYAKPLPPSSRPPPAPSSHSRLPVAGTPQRRSDFANSATSMLQVQPATAQRMVGSASSPSIPQQVRSASLRQSLSPRSTSPSTSLVDEDEQQGDLEMAEFLRRQKARKASGNWKSGDIDNFLDFPEPGKASREQTPHDFIKRQFDQLSVYERAEIQEYSIMWFAGDKQKKNPATPEAVHNNHGYDDERGDYLIIDGDHLAYRYEVQGVLGKGSFGQVVQCLDHRSGEWVAVKIIRNKKRFHQQALTEIQLLENLLRWDPEDKHNMIKMTEHFYFRGHLCIVTELLSLNLYELIKANGFIGFSSRLLRRFTVQLLASMQVMRANRVIHCDLKPENILLRHPAKSGIKVIDFGSSCFEHEKVYTYIQSRFYRSPEIILGTNYNMAIDMWSLGCILAEMYTGFPIFPGENEQEQLTCIMEIMGPPDRVLIERCTRRKLFFEPDGTPKSYVNSKGKRRRPSTKTLGQVLKSDDEGFVDFIAKCLTWDPEKRLKPGMALHHPWIQEGRKRVLASNGVASPSNLSRPARAPGSSLSTMGSPLGSTAQRHRSLYQEAPKPRISEPSPLTARRAPAHGTYTTGSLSALPAGPARQYRATQHQSMRSYAEPARAAL